MPFRKLFSRKPPPTVQEMRIDEDVDGLVRALADPSADVVRDAAKAITSLSLHGRPESIQKASGAGPALIAAYLRQQDALEHLTAPHELLEKGDRRYAQWDIIDALGAIRAPGAEPLLQQLVKDTRADAYLRGRAAAALGRVAGATHFRLLSRLFHSSDTPRELAEGAAAGLIAAGMEGATLVQDNLTTSHRRDFVASVTKALQHLGGEYEEAANRVLSAIAEEAAWQSGQRKAWEEAVVARRLKAFPVTAKLATLLGHPEWTADHNLIKTPSAVAYDEAVAACRALGLAVEETESDPQVRILRNSDDFGREETAEETTCHLSAAIQFEGESIAITGGLRTRRVEL